MALLKPQAEVCEQARKAADRITDLEGRERTLAWLARQAENRGGHVGGGVAAAGR
jgi:hypothetical protein